MPTVLFSPAQRDLVEGAESIEIAATRVDELVAALCRRYPSLDGQLDHAAVSVDGVIYNDATYVPLPAEAEVMFVGAIAGGSLDSISDAAARGPGDPLGFAAAAREAGRPVALATVVETWGSSPCPAGSLLAVDDGGDFEGSVSGGCVEGAVIEKAAEVLASGQPAELEFGVADEDAWAVGLACGGRVRIFVERLG